jgi:hypothetical protein
LDGLRHAAVLVLSLVAAGCASTASRPKRLLDGRPAVVFRPVPDSVVAAGRVLRLADVGGNCLFAGDRDDVAPDAYVVERVGVDNRSLTFANRDGTGVYACDGGADAAGERPTPWCATVFGELLQGRLLDPRLDVLCRDRERRPIAYAFVEPLAEARWVGVRQAGYVELYEALAGLPVRIATARALETDAARARFEIIQYDAHGRELVAGTLEAGVAG